MPDHPKLTTQKGQNATKPADPEEAPSKPKATPEHPFGHPNVPTQKDPARNSTDSQCFSIFSLPFSNSNLISVPFYNSNLILYL
jgi:hypothetical protein